MRGYAHPLAVPRDPDTFHHTSGFVVTGASRCSLHGNIEMRILSKRQLKELILYSPQHVARMEKAGQFPKRVHLGPSRVGWVEAEVLEWLQARLACREAPN